MTHRLLLDTSSLLYRAFFALPRSMTDPQGRPVNAVRGVLDMHARLLIDHRPEDALHVLDADWRPAERVAAYAGYKADRPEEPDALPWQFELLLDVLGACGIDCVESPGWEADDAIAALCAEATAGDRIDIVTGDRDLLQLVRDESEDAAAVRVLFTVKGVSQLGVFDEAAVLDKYGVPASRYADFAMLRGDSSDGLPGVPGVGERTAARLVQAYPSLEALLAADDSGSSALVGRLRGSEAYLKAMLDIVPLRGDVPVRRRHGRRDDARLDELAQAHALEGPVNRLKAALDA
ncbi:MAG TPA: 5'-3' exonuclease [Egibacteraceae bacterium]|nr:5'-3' exonuclease [Egibacteraceae bacterium]